MGRKIHVLYFVLFVILIECSVIVAEGARGQLHGPRAVSKESHQALLGRHGIFNDYVKMFPSN